MTIHHVKSKSEWLTLRHQFVSSTESAALFGLSPYLTKFELFHAKQKDEPTQLEASERMEWGLRLEEAIARSIADVYGVKARKLNAFVSNDAGLGASFDYEIIGIKDDVTPEDTVLQAMYRDRGAGILEIKNVDWLVFKRTWTNDGDSLEAPGHIEVQVQTQLHVIERAWAAIGVLVGGNTLKLLVRERDVEVGKRLDEHATAFWRDVKGNRAPPVMLPEDADLIGYLYAYAEPDKVLDAQGDSEMAAKIAELAKEYDDASVLMKGAENRRKAAKAALLQLIGDSERVLCRDGYQINAGMVADAEIKAYTRKGYRNFTVKKK